MPRRADHKIRGEQAECAFIWQAARHNLLVSIPFGATGPYDLIVQPRRPPGSCRPPLWCIQVKCTTYLSRSHAYTVNARRHTRPYAPSEVDFLAAWVMPVNVWYIIPLRAIHGRVTISLFPQVPRSRGMLEKYREAWHLLL